MFLENEHNTNNKPFLMEIDDIFSEEECKQLIERANNQGYEYVDRGIAQYFRTIFDDKGLAQNLYTQLYHLIPKTFNGKKVQGLNNIFRISKYIKGCQFQIHKDGVNQDNRGNRSVMTLNIFLNDDFEGGETDFFNSFNNLDLRFSVKPKTGRGALFDSQQYHKGNEILQGFKYLIRTDVMVGP